MQAHSINEVSSRRANTVKVYGAVRVRGVREFISLCTRKGVPMRLLNCVSIRRKGYRGRKFDNRHIEVQLASRGDAMLLDRSLRWAQENVAEMRQWRHELTYTQRLGRNAFLPLADLCRHTNLPSENATICCWNINTTKGKSREICFFLSRNKIDVLGVVETSGDSDCLKDKVPGYTWFGRAKSRRAGGVGFLVNDSILTQCKVEVRNGRTADTIFLRITPENSRTTLLMLVYGKAAATKDESVKQWSSLESDWRAQLKQCPRDTDTILLGDINARMGRAVNEAEKHHISIHGESTRNASGREALAFLQRTDLVCLNNRDEKQEVPDFTYRERGKAGRSVIDVICTSRGLFSRCSEAKVLPETLTGRESHFPVTCSIRWHRRRPRPRFMPKRSVWNLKKLKAPECRARFQEECDSAIQTLPFKSTVTENARALRGVLCRAAEETIAKTRVGGKPRKSREERKCAKAASDLREYRRKHHVRITNGSDEHLAREKDLESKYRSLMKEKKIKRHKKLARKLMAQQNEGNVRGVMRTTREFSEEKVQSSPDITIIADADHRIQTSTQNILRVFEETWGPRLKNPNFSEEMKAINLEGLANVDHNPLCDAPITNEELDSALSTLEFHKAQGLDELSPAFFMQATEQMKSFLLRTFNQALASGEFPEEWKTDKRMPLHKSGPKTDVDNYRLLAINSVYRKLFCSVLKKRIESLIVLDDAQNGFRRNRRASDNIAIVQGIIQEATLRHGAHAQLIVADFSKAFDTCHIPTLLKKLAKYGLRGNLLRVIADMYTNARARMCVNGVLGKPIEVTNGVAQGCVLSPVFFTIYIDELLRKFRDSGLGIPIGALVQAAMSFADDLLLASPDSATSQKYLDILSRWCRENKLKINVSKSGIFRSHRAAPKESERLYLNEQPLQFLDEDDEKFEERRNFEYLGVTFGQKGKWIDFLEMQRAKMRRAFGSNHAFFSEAPVPIKLKVQTAHILVFSLGMYCADVSHTKDHHIEGRLDAVQANVLRTILHLPKNTSHAKIRHILGQSRISFSRLRARVSNFVRIQHLPSDTRLREILDGGSWDSAMRLFGKFANDLQEVRRLRKLSSVSDDALSVALEKGSPLQVRRVLKTIVSEADIAENAHTDLRQKHPELLNWSSSLDHPMWKRSAYEVGSHARWLTGTARLSSQRYVASECLMCEQCGAEIVSSLEEHCLLGCSFVGAQDTRSEFYRKLCDISKEIGNRYSVMSNREKLAWLLTGGGRSLDNRSAANNLRMQPIQSPFLAGDSVSPINGKKDPWTNWISYEQFKEIECNHLADIQIYTDGSAPEGLAGIGIVIFVPGKREPIHCASVEIGRASNNVAELEAIHYALQWVLDNCNSVLKPAIPIRIYTDSQYSRDMLLKPIPTGEHFYLLESILALGGRLRFELNSIVTLHWIPSHIEHTIGGWRPIYGNRKADKLAEVARDRSRDEHSERQVATRREKVSKLISCFLRDMETVFKTANDRKQVDGPSADDFVIDASQEISSASSDT